MSITFTKTIHLRADLVVQMNLATRITSATQPKPENYGLVQISKFRILHVVKKQVTLNTVSGVHEDC